MRTKTLILSGLLAALSGASALAQVYSLNAVGYINVDVPPGWSIIADQLYVTNQQTANTIDSVFGPQLVYAYPTAATVDPYVGVVIYPWVNQTGSFTGPYIVQQTGAGAGGASFSTPATGTSFNPGQASFIFNPNADFQITFVGQVPQGPVTNTLYASPGGGPQWNMISSIIPQTGAIDLDLGIVPTAGDYVYLWSPAYQVSGNWVQGSYATPNQWQRSANGSTTNWTIGTPTNTVGTGFFYLNTSGGQTNWIRNFNIN